MESVKNSKTESTQFRKTRQALLPQLLSPGREESDQYNMYPCRSLGSGKIFHGYSSLAEWILQHDGVIIDGYSGVLWKEVCNSLHEIFQQLGVKIKWFFSEDYLKSRDEIERLVKPFLGTQGSVWGRRCPYSLSDFFDTSLFQNIKKDKTAHCTIIIGPGAALCNWSAPVIYLEVPKNEIQYRMRAGSVTNLGAEGICNLPEMYKRFYFVDWVVFNAHKKIILDKISILADVQWQGSVNWSFSETIQTAFDKISETSFRVRPWFEPGAWGGQWMKEKITGLNKEEINYAWSFELIAPENGIVFESDGYLLELAFDFLMFWHAQKVTGKHASFFGDEFPIRFDFLDTWDGGNLSIQCHPSLKYIREHFGEHITQDETYYILDCKNDAGVYLGLQENVDGDVFKKELQSSYHNNTPVDIHKYVQLHKANKHDLFLIPNGTIHSAGTDNLVLEISSTPYIFTFKMYDWLRLDLNGEPRPINIEHAFNNLRFDYSGSYVEKELICRPKQIGHGADWELFHLPTHKHHFYDVHRVEFETRVTLFTGNSCNVLMLVEGSSITVYVNGERQVYYYAETFVIPAAAKEYTIVNNGQGRAKVVKAFIKESIEHLKPVAAD